MSAIEIARFAGAFVAGGMASLAIALLWRLFAPVGKSAMLAICFACAIGLGVVSSHLIGGARTSAFFGNILGSLVLGAWLVNQAFVVDVRDATPTNRGLFNLVVSLQPAILLSGFARALLFGARQPASRFSDPDYTEIGVSSGVALALALIVVVAVGRYRRRIRLEKVEAS